MKRSEIFTKIQHLALDFEDQVFEESEIIRRQYPAVTMHALSFKQLEVQPGYGPFEKLAFYNDTIEFFHAVLANRTTMRKTYLEMIEFQKFYTTVLPRIVQLHKPKPWSLSKDPVKAIENTAQNYFQQMKSSSSANTIRTALRNSVPREEVINNAILERLYWTLYDIGGLAGQLRRELLVN